jgi:hypothetical protein
VHLVPKNIKDMRLVMKAIKERWRIPDSIKDELIAQMVKIAKGEIPDTKPRDRIRAAEALLAAEAQNQAQEQIEQPAAPIIHEHRFDQTLSVDQRADSIIAALLEEQSRRLGEDRSAIEQTREPPRPLPNGSDPEAADFS